MKKLFGLIVLLYLCRAGTGQSVSPAVISSSGGEQTVPGVSITWTLGEIMTATYEVPGIILTQGFQQSSYTIETVAESLRTGENVKVYPVPAGDVIHIDASGLKKTGTMRVIMYNLQGKKIMDRMSAESRTDLNLRNLKPGAYLIEIYDRNNHFIKSVKITRK